MLFDGYLFADYSGARNRRSQRKSIRLARAAGSQRPLLVCVQLTREDLVDEFVSDLLEARRLGKRICFGQDHQYGIPIALGRELGLTDLPWRQVLDSLCGGAYGEGAPALCQAGQFGREFNRWLTSQGRSPYFFSATKAGLYGIPNCDPRNDSKASYRLTEMCRSSSRAGAPKAFNRLGDNGTVGGQSLVGLMAINSLLSRCRTEGIPVAVWPFDGLSITEPAYADAHVMIEPYPTAVRDAQVKQSDAADAVASVAHVQEADQRGALELLLNLSNLDLEQARVVRFEGWIFSYVSPSEPSRSR